MKPIEHGAKSVTTRQTQLHRLAVEDCKQFGKIVTAEQLIRSPGSTEGQTITMLHHWSSLSSTHIIVTIDEAGQQFTL